MDNELHLGREEVEETLAVARHLIRCYLAARDGLRELGILRSHRSFQGDYAEWLVAHLLHLELSGSSVAKGIDARSDDGTTYQIKSRLVKDLSETTSFDLRSLDPPFDYLVAVFFERGSLDILGILRVQYEVVRELGSQTRDSFSFRWNRSVAEDPRIERIAWTDRYAEQGSAS